MLRVKQVAVWCGIVVLVLSAGLSLCSGEGKRSTELSASEARKRAVQAVGLPEKTVKSISRRTVTDAAAPSEVKNLPVWEVVFAGVKLDGNRRISSLRVWLDSRTGALVKVFSPHPREGGLELMQLDEHRRWLADEAISSELPAIPGQPLARVLASRKSGLSMDLPKATEIVAYYGMYREDPPEAPFVVSRPAWFVYLGGIKHAMSSGPSNGPRRDVYGSELLVILDAATGESCMALLIGPPDRK